MAIVSTSAVGLLILVGAYIAGSFPTASLIGAFSGHDHSREGSGNPGASIVYRTSGAAYGLLTVLIDAAKGFIPVVLALWLATRPWASAAWVAATLGHIVPLGRWGSGGKGVATAGGGSTALFPLLTIPALALFAVVVKVTKRASVGSLSLVTLMCVAVAILRESLFELFAAVVVAVIITYRHRSNIGRLLSGDELTVN